MKSNEQVNMAEINGQPRLPTTLPEAIKEIKELKARNAEQHLQSRIDNYRTCVREVEADLSHLRRNHAWDRVGTLLDVIKEIQKGMMVIQLKMPAKSKRSASSILRGIKLEIKFILSKIDEARPLS